MAVSQIFITKSSAKIEQRKYQVLRKFDKFEIRRYEPALYSSVKLGATSYNQSANQGFRILAGYIFGGNETNEKISMTSPVTMELGDSSKMMFMVPKSHSLNDLPKPNNSSIVFENQGEKVFAAIEFNGWANDKKIAKYQSILKEQLEKEGIFHTNKFAFLGYNAPFEIINRRNEVIVELIDYKNQSNN